MKVYLSGKMRGLPEFNFPAFHSAAKELRARGYDVVSPAELDIEAGFDPNDNSLEHFDLDAAIRRDVEGVLNSDALVLLPGWESSAGVKGELAIAEWAGREILYYEDIVSN